MGALFRGKMLAAHERAHARGHLDLGDVDLRTLRGESWIVYAKRPFGGPEQVIRYLGRYTHRVGISNQRLVSMDERGVTFRAKDGNAVTVTGYEMLARFAQHVLPPRFVKMRHYGLHSASHAKTRLEVARNRITPAMRTRERLASTDDVTDWRELLLRLSGLDMRLCPACHQPALVRPHCQPCVAAHRQRPRDLRSLALGSPASTGDAGRHFSARASETPFSTRARRGPSYAAAGVVDGTTRQDRPAEHASPASA